MHWDNLSESHTHTRYWSDFCFLIVWNLKWKRNRNETHKKYANQMISKQKLNRKSDKTTKRRLLVYKILVMKRTKKARNRKKKKKKNIIPLTTVNRDMAQRERYRQRAKWAKSPAESVAKRIRKTTAEKAKKSNHNHNSLSSFFSFSVSVTIRQSLCRYISMPKKNPNKYARIQLNQICANRKSS